MIRRIAKEFAALRFWWIALFVVEVLLGLFAGVGAGVDSGLQRMAALRPQDLSSSFTMVVSHNERLIAVAALVQVVLFHLASATLFGGEFAYNTLPSLLAQPIARWRIWTEKIAVFFLIAAFVILGNARIAHEIIHRLQLWPLTQDVIAQQYLDFFRGVIQAWLVFTLCGALLALASGPFLALTLRQTHTAFWASLVLPVFAATLFGVIDYSILVPWTGFSMSAWLNHTLFGVFGEFNLMAIFTIVWFLLFLPLGWLKFKRLEV